MQAGNYALFLVLFGPLRGVASGAFHGRGSVGEVAAVWAILAQTVLASSGLELANTALTVAVERDW